MSLGVSALNAIMRVFLREVTITEGHHTFTQVRLSAFNKMWTVMFVNTAIILYLVNAKFKKLNLDDNFWLIGGGKYSDFTGGWYGEVGATIAITCFITCVMPFSNILFILQKGVLRCWDRGCTCDRSRTKKILQWDYE
jgi:hypothetical protein